MTRPRIFRVGLREPSRLLGDFSSPGTGGIAISESPGGTRTGTATMFIRDWLRSLRTTKSSTRKKRSRRRKRLVPVESLEQRLLLTTIAWDGEAGDGDWHNAANWFDQSNSVNDVLPTADDDVVIGSAFAGDTIVIAPSTTVDINSINSAAAITIEASATLEIAADSQIDGAIELAGNIEGTGTLTVTSSMNWTGGRMTDNGSTVIAGGAVLTVDAASVALRSGRLLQNHGTVNWLRGNLDAREGSGIHNNAGALFDLQVNVQLGSTLSGTFVNYGTFRKSVGTGTALMVFPFENTGLIEVQAGTLQLYAGESTGDILLSDGTTLTKSNSGSFIFDIQAGKRVGRANPADQNVTFDVNGVATLQGTGDFDFDAIELSLGTLNLERDVSVPHVELDGTIAGAHTLTVTESMTWLRGGLTDNVTLEIADGAVLTTDSISGGVSMGTGAMLENHGVVNWVGGGLNATGGTGIHNTGGALFDVMANVSIGGAFINDGELRKSAGEGATTISELENTGIVHVDTGTLRLANGNSTGDILLADGTTLHQSGLSTYMFDIPAGRRIGRASGTDENVSFRVDGTATLQGDGAFDVDTIELVLGTLNLDRDVTVPHVELDGTIAGPHTLTVTESMNWLRGGFSDDVTAIITDGAVLIADGNDGFSMRSGSTLENHGTVNWVRGSLNAQSGSSIQNTSGGLFDIQANVTLGDTSAPGPFVNEGILRNSFGNGTTTLRFPLENTGTVEVQTGTLRLSGAGTVGGDILLSDNTTLEANLGPFGNLTFDVSAGRRIGRANAADQNVTFRVVGDVTLQGTGDFDFDAIEIDNGALHVDRDVTVPRIEQDGTIDGTGTLTVTQSMDWLRGNMDEDGTTVIAEGAVLNIDVIFDGGKSLNNGRTLENHGTVNWRQGPLSVISGSRIHNMPGGVFEVSIGAILSTNGGEVFRNDGIFRKSTSSAPVQILLPFENNGTVDVRIGTLRLSESRNFDNSGPEHRLDGGTWIVSTADPNVISAGIAVDDIPLVDVLDANVHLDGAGASFRNNVVPSNNVRELLISLNRIEPGASLHIDHGYDLELTLGDLENNGSLTLGSDSTLSIPGNYTQSADATFAVGLAGDEASGQFGQIVAGGDAMLDGTLEMLLVDGFGPSQGQTWTVLASAARTGDFADVEVPFLGRDPALEVVNTPDSVVVNGLVDAADLRTIATDIVVPLNGIAGEDVTIEYTVENLSELAATGDWVDSLYLSIDSELDANDLLIARHTHNGGLAGLQSYTETVTAPLPGSLGEYRIIVVADSRGLVPDADRVNNRGVSVGVIDVDVQTLPVGDTVVTTIADGEEQFYRIDVPPNGSVRVFANQESAGQVELFARFGEVPDRSNFDISATDLESLSQQILLAEQTGRWYLLIQGRENAGEGATVELSTELLDFEALAVSPLGGGNVGRTTVTITGVGFGPNASAKLIHPDGTEYPPASRRYLSSTRLSVTFDLKDLPPDNYQIRVDNNEQSSTIPGVFNVFESDNPGQLEFHVESPNAVGVNAVANIRISYTNIGDSDALLLPVMLEQTASPNVPLSFNQAIVSLNDGDEEVDVTQVLDGLSAGVVPPGGTGMLETELWFATDIDDLSPPILNFELNTPLIEPEQFYHWLNVKNRTRPADISTDAWDEIYANFMSRVGDTRGGLQVAIAEAAQYLTSIGHRVSDTDELIGFLFTQADNSITNQTLAAAIDAADTAPGIPLVFSRTYQQPISSRLRQGAFGRGWAHSYETSLRFTEDNVPYLITPGGVRAFEEHPQSGILDLISPTQPFIEIGGSAKFVNDVLYEPDGTRLEFFNPGGKLSKITDSNGNVVDLIVQFGRLARIEHSNGDVITLEYNGDGQIERLTDPANRVTSYTYDASGEHLVEARGPYGTVSYEYETDSTGPRAHALNRVTHLDGTRTAYAYDEQGRLVRVEQLDNSSPATPLTIDYNEGQVTYTNAQDESVAVFYNSRGQAMRFIDPVGQTVEVDYTREISHTILTVGDNPIQPLVPQKRYSQRADFVERVVLPDGSAIRSKFDIVGFLRTVSDPLGNDSHLSINATARTTAMLKQGGVITVTPPWQYRPARFTDQLERLTRFDYDEQGNLLKLTYPDGAAEEFLDYDDNGNLLRHRNRRGQEFAYRYNSDGQVTRILRPGGAFDDYAYDERGNLKSATNAHGTVSLQYDALDRLTRVEYANGRWLQYDYNAGSQLVSLTDHAGNATQYAYDELGRLSELTDTSDDLIVRYAYDSTGRMLREDRGNGTYTTYAYDAAGRLLHLVHHAPDDSINSRFDYTYDTLGRRVAMETLDGEWTYGYDALGQLTSAEFASTNPAIPDQGLEYFYDAAGNRTRTIENGVVTLYGVNNRNQYTTVGDAVYTYDADGNLTRIEDGGDVTTYEYDDESRLIGVTTPTETWSYEYDALGNRIATVHEGQRTEYLIDPTGLGNVQAEYDGTGNLIAHYNHGLGLESRSSGGQAAYYDFNGIGSTVGLSDATGAYVNEYRYEPYGDLLTPATEAITNPFEFVGEFGVMAEDSGLEFMRARLYSADDGRFLSEDPLHFGGGDTNLYSYGFNNPISVIDPTGEAGILIRARSAFFKGYLVVRTALASHYPFNPGGHSKPTPVQLAEIERISLGRGANKIKTTGAGAGLLGIFFAGDANAATGETSTGNSDSAAYDALGLIGTEWLKEKILPYGTGEEIWDSLVFSAKLSTGFVDFGGILCDLLDCDATRELAASGTVVVASYDPNDIIGPTGFGEDGFLTGESPLPYTIRFENQDEATAPAQLVVITQQLDPDLDWNTFEVGDFGFGGLTVDVPAGRDYYRTRLDLVDTLGVLVDFEAGINRATGLVTWTITALDPETLDLPVSPLVGFLPPNNIPPQGDGFVNYTIRSRSGLPTGTRLDAEASIVFDRNEAIETPPIYNTIDVGQPTSSVDPLPAETTETSFTVTWNGSDDAGGSGIGTYSVFVSTNGGPFTPFVAQTDQASATFTGEAGSTYAFYSIATDNVGHVESKLPTAESTISVVNTITRPNIQGDFIISGLAAEIQQTGNQLTFTNEHGSVSQGRFLDETRVIADGWEDGLVGVLAGHRIEWANGSVWAAPIIGGEYFINSQSAMILQDGLDLTFENEHGSRSEGRLVGEMQVLATDWEGGLLGTIVDSRIEWANSTVWIAPGISGLYVIDGEAARIEQFGKHLEFTNEHGGKSYGQLLSPTQLVADNWGGLTAEIDRHRINWANGSVWETYALDGEYTINGQTARVEQLGTGLRLTNEHNDQTLGRIQDDSSVMAYEWADGLVGRLGENQIEWQNGTIWESVLEWDSDLLFNRVSEWLPEF